MGTPSLRAVSSEKNGNSVGDERGGKRERRERREGRGERGERGKRNERGGKRLEENGGRGMCFFSLSYLACIPSP